MALTFSKTSDYNQPKHILLYGESGIGKTTTIATLPRKSDARILYVGVDPGQLALSEYDFEMASVRTQEDLRDLYLYCRDHAEEFDWVALDGVDEILEMMLNEELKCHKDGRQAYGELRQKFPSWIKAMRDLSGLNMLFITHIGSTRDGDGPTTYHPTLPWAKMEAELPNWFDIVGCMRLCTTESGGQDRKIQFNRNSAPQYTCKDRSGKLDTFEDPDWAAIYKKMSVKKK